MFFSWFKINIKQFYTRRDDRVYSDPANPKYEILLRQEKMEKLR
jgi:hypothetical protein